MWVFLVVVLYVGAALCRALSARPLLDRPARCPSRTSRRYSAGPNAAESECHGGHCARRDARPRKIVLLVDEGHVEALFEGAMATAPEGVGVGHATDDLLLTNWVVHSRQKRRLLGRREVLEGYRGSRGPGSAPLNRSAVRSGPSTPIVGFPQFSRSGSMSA